MRDDIFEKGTTGKKKQTQPKQQTQIFIESPGDSLEQRKKAWFFPQLPTLGSSFLPEAQ